MLKHTHTHMYFPFFLSLPLPLTLSLSHTHSYPLPHLSHSPHSSSPTHPHPPWSYHEGTGFVWKGLLKVGWHLVRVVLQFRGSLLIITAISIMPYKRADLRKIKATNHQHQWHDSFNSERSCWTCASFTQHWLSSWRLQCFLFFFLWFADHKY